MIKRDWNKILISFFMYLRINPDKEKKSGVACHDVAPNNSNHFSTRIIVYFLSGLFFSIKVAITRSRDLNSYIAFDGAFSGSDMYSNGILSHVFSDVNQNTKSNIPELFLLTEADIIF
jgi:hypothetical protein